LPWTTTVADLAALFSPHGAVAHVRIAADQSGRPRGFGFLKMADVQAALGAIGISRSFFVVASLFHLFFLFFSSFFFLFSFSFFFFFSSSSYSYSSSSSSSSSSLSLSGW
jgi:RNA recognition motif-containing protein